MVFFSGWIKRRAFRDFYGKERPGSFQGTYVNHILDRQDLLVTMVKEVSPGGGGTIFL